MTMEQTKLRKSGKNKTAPRRSDSCCIKMAARNSLVKRTLASLAKEQTEGDQLPFGRLGWPAYSHRESNKLKSDFQGNKCAWFGFVPRIAMEHRGRSFCWRSRRPLRDRGK